jgi:hypothetical protein
MTRALNKLEIKVVDREKKNTFPFKDLKITGCDQIFAGHSINIYIF